MYTLTVIHPFGDYRRGDPIKDLEEVKAVLAGENAHHTVKVIRTDAPREMPERAAEQDQKPE